MTEHLSLADYGWSAHFQSQLSLDEIETALPVRVSSVHRTAYDALGPEHAGQVALLPPEGDNLPAVTVGDWLLLDRFTRKPLRRLDRTSLFKRRVAGLEGRVQLIAANVDTLFLVTSCNQDFNPARLERYLALAQEAEVMPVIVMTKADLAEDEEPFRAAAEGIMRGLVAETVDARSAESLDRLAPWLKAGQTIALIGSSGVGKSTLVNTLAGRDVQATQGIREDDAKGRHTTTGRSLHRLPTGAWLMDTPGMRELQITDVAEGLDRVFEDVALLIANCRFSDCQHREEPGCAVRAAIEAGTLDPERLKRYEKLQREDRRNTEEIWQRNQRIRSFAKAVRTHVERKNNSRKPDR